MAQIYKIINDINDKVYIGKTTFSIEKRWREHKHDLYIKNKHHRPLYKAMLKYGIEHFHIELLEECSREELNSREQYWIKQYDSFHNGYNATRGGDGKLYIESKPIIELWEAGYPLRQIGFKLNIDTDTARNILRDYGISEEEIISRKMIQVKKKVIQKHPITNEILGMYDSTENASRAVISTPSGGTHITACCKHKRKTAYGFIWEYAE